MNITTTSDSDALYLARQWRQSINLQLEKQKAFAEEHKRYAEFYEACKKDKPHVTHVHQDNNTLHEGEK